MQLLCWLVLDNKIQSRKNFKKRGFIGPMHCSICNVDDKSIDHLFVSCVFSQQVWSEVLRLLEITNNLEHNSIEGNLRKWGFSVGSHKSLPLFVIWGL